MSQLYTNVLNALVVLIAAGTVFELWRQRNNLFRDELDDEIRALAWRVVIFLIFPFVVWLDLRATIVATDYFGGWVRDWNYGLLWFSAVPLNLPHSDFLVPVLFAGVIVQLVLCLCTLPSLFFRPHPFMASIITYTISLILASNLIIDPVIALAGAGNSRWQLAYACAPRDALMIIIALYACFSALFLVAVRSKRLRIWFAELTSPVIAEQLRIALSEAQFDRRNQYQCCRLGILFERAGMKSNAKRELWHLRKIASDSIYVPFLEGYINYRRRNYKKARAAFEYATRFAPLSDVLRATFYAAAACSAFAEGDTDGSINLSERALEFDNNSLVARMVKVDAYLRLGKKELAGEEVLAALRQGLDFEIEDKVPLDPDFTLKQIFRFQRTAATSSSAQHADQESVLIRN